MNKKSLANKVIPGAKLNKKLSEFALSAIFERIRLYVKGNKKFIIPGFGEFYVERRKMHTMVDHNKKALVLLPPKDKILFKFYSEEESKLSTKQLDESISTLIKEVTEELTTFHEFKRINFDDTACYDFFWDLFNRLKESLQKEKNINIGEFGKFKAKDQIVNFSPSRKFAEDINYNFSNLNSQVVRQLSKNEFEKFGIKEEPERKKEEKPKLKDVEPEEIKRIEKKLEIKVEEKPVLEKKIPEAKTEEKKIVKAPEIKKPLEEFKPLISEEDLLKEEFLEKAKEIDEISIASITKPEIITEDKIPLIEKVEEPIVPVIIPEVKHVIPPVEKTIVPQEPAEKVKEPEIKQPETPVETFVYAQDKFKSTYTQEDEVINLKAFKPEEIAPAIVSTIPGEVTKGEPTTQPYHEEEAEEALSIGDVYAKLKKSFSVMEDAADDEEDNLSEEDQEKREFLKRKTTFETKWQEHKLDEDSPVKSEIIESKPEIVHTEEEIVSEYEDQRKKFEEELKHERETHSFTTEHYKLEEHYPEAPKIPDFTQIQGAPIKATNVSETIKTESAISEIAMPTAPVFPQSANNIISDENGIDSIPINMDNSPIIFNEPVNNLKPDSEIKQKEVEEEFPSSMNDYFEQKQEGTLPEEQYPQPDTYSAPAQEYIAPEYFQEEEQPKSQQQRIFGIPVVAIFIFLLTAIIALGGYALYISIEKRSNKFKDLQENIDTIKQKTPPVDSLKKDSTIEGTEKEK